MNKSMEKIVIVGGGPAGMMAAIKASQLTSNVILIEKNDILGKKLLLTFFDFINFKLPTDFYAFNSLESACHSCKSGV